MSSMSVTYKVHIIITILYQHRVRIQGIQKFWQHREYQLNNTYSYSKRFCLIRNTLMCNKLQYMLKFSTIFTNASNNSLD